MLDKSLPYMDIIMKAPEKIASNQSLSDLPDGYCYKMYEPGDEIAWAKLETSVNEFDSMDKAMEYFYRVFMPYQDILNQRMAFILNEQNEIIATSSAWFKEDKNKRYALLHWVSTCPKEQGKGLGGAIVKYVLSLFPKVEPKEDEVFLHTQTWSYKAIGMYYHYGFRITDVPLLDCKTNRKCFNVLEKVLDKEIMNDIEEGR